HRRQPALHTSMHHGRTHAATATRNTSSALDVGNGLHHAPLVLQRARLIAGALTRDLVSQLRRLTPGQSDSEARDEYFACCRTWNVTRRAIRDALANPS